jgi:hypothetical protein
LELWNGQIKRKQTELNFQSIAIAKQSILLELGFSSFGGSSDKVKLDLSRYLPFPEEDKKESLTPVSRKAIERFTRLRKAGKIPTFVEKSFLKSDLVDRLK